MSDDLSEAFFDEFCSSSSGHIFDRLEGMSWFVRGKGSSTVIELFGSANLTWVMSCFLYVVKKLELEVSEPC